MEGKIGNFSAKLRDLMQGPVEAFRMVKDALLGIGNATVGQASKIEDMVAAFTPLTGSASNATAMIAALNKEAASTPYELTGIGDIAKQLLPMLGNNVEAVTSTFRMLGDTAGGSIEKLDSITRGYVKTLNKGKVDMESLNMIADAGVPIYTQLAKSMGVSVTKMTEMSSQGLITSADLTKAFQKMTSEGGIFYKGMELASQTLTGKISTMQDNLAQSGAVVGDAFLPITKGLVDAVSIVAGGFVTWAREGSNLADTMNILGIAVASMVGGLVAFFIAAKGTAIIDGLAVAFRALGVAMAANPIGMIAAVITAILIPAIILLIENWDQVVLIFQTTLANIKKIFSDVASGLELGWTVAINGTKLMILSLAQTITGFLLKAVSDLLHALSGIPLIGDQFKGAAAAVDQFRGNVDKAMEAAKKDSLDAIKAGVEKQKAAAAANAAELAAFNEQAKIRQAEIDAIKKKKAAVEEVGKTEVTTSTEAVDATKAEIKAALEKAALEKKVAEDVLKAKLDALTKQEKAELEAAKDAKKPAADRLKIAEKYDEQELEVFKTMIEGQRTASLAEAEARGVDAATIASINALYSGQITEFERQQADERKGIHEEEAKDLEGDWAAVFAQMVLGAQATAKNMKDVLVAVGDKVGNAIADLTKDLIQGKDAWGNLGKVALTVMADVLTAIGHELVARAALAALTGNWVGAGIAAAGAVAAYVAAGAVKAWAASYKVGSLDIQGDQLAQLHDSEMVLTPGISNEARSKGIYIGPAASVGAGAPGSAGRALSGNSTTLIGTIEVDGMELGRAMFAYQDRVYEERYGA